MSSARYIIQPVGWLHQTSWNRFPTPVNVKVKGERTSKKNLVLNESKYDEGDLCEI